MLSARIERNEPNEKTLVENRINLGTRPNGWDGMIIDLKFANRLSTPEGLTDEIYPNSRDVSPRKLNILFTRPISGRSQLVRLLWLQVHEDRETIDGKSDWR